MENKDKIEKLLSYIDGELSPEDRVEMEALLHEDIQLQQDLEAFRRVNVLYRGLEKKHAPPEFEHMVRKRLERTPRTIRFRRPGLKEKPVWHLVAAAACLMLVLAATLYQLSLVSRNTNRFTVSLNRTAADQTSPSPAAEALSVGQKSDEIMPQKKQTSAESFEEPEPEGVESHTPPTTSPAQEKADMELPQLPTKTVDTFAEKMSLSQSADTKNDGLSSGRLGVDDKLLEKPLARELRKQALAKKDDKETIRQLAGREFIFEENEWRERGYSGEETLSLSRDAKETSQFFSQHAPLAPILQWKEPVVFRIDSKWYRLR
ncbi:MAG TPA: hypothetical protein PKY35_01625 [Candidatus Hydrogenedentes bacterium]|nr:hypothetical protein [Candidatus Hydrogenedentota bacterium]HOL75702.1 hypothetical protein [Candidatus Hydrogenedentota bacterium]HPO84305.1 hypothetical protein [Candidatus Hydrogenedentota bacterium]